MKKEPGIILGNAIIWGAVILATSSKLKGTGLFDEVLPVLGAGAAFSLLMVGMIAVKGKQG